MVKMFRSLLIILVACVVGALLGLWFGMFIGGNFFTDVEFLNMVGYELFGTIGLIAGVVLFFILAIIYVLNQKLNQNNKTV